MARSLASSRSLSSNRVSVQNFPASLSFNGTSSLMTSAVAPSTSGFCIGLWLKLPSNYGAAGNRYIDWESALNTDGFYLTSTTSQQLTFQLWNNTTGAGTINYQSPSANTWLHVVISYLPGSKILYVNGVSVASSANASAITVPAGQSLTFGKRSYAATFVQCQMQQVILHNTATPWTAAQVLALYQSGTIPTGATQVLLLTEGAGTVAYDTSGNGNNGTITAGTYTSDVPSGKRGLVGGNLVYNGDFEYAPPSGANVATTTNNRWLDGTSGGSTTNALFGWFLNVGAGSAAGLIDSSTPHSGNYSIKSSTTATSSASTVENNSATALNALPISPSTSYTLTYWMKTVANSGAATTGAQVVLSERSGSFSGGASTSSTGVTTTTGWTQYQLVWTTASTARYLIVKLNVTGNDGAATLVMDAWFDDITLTPTTNTTRSLA